LEDYIKKFDEFEELPEAEKRERRELYLKRIIKQNQKDINKLKDD